MEQRDARVAQRAVRRVVADRRRPRRDDRLPDTLLVLLVQLDEVLRERVAHAGEHAGDRREQQVDVRVGEHQLEHGAVLRPRRDHAARVERVVATEEPRHVLGQGVDGVLREPRDRDTDAAAEVGDVRGGAARHRVHADTAAPLEQLRVTEQPRQLDHLVEVVDPDHAELVEHGLVDSVRAGEVPGVGLCHRAAFVGATDLDRDDRHAPLRGLVGGEHERTPVAEALDVGGDGADALDVDVVADEVGPLEVGLVADRRPRLDADAEYLALGDRAALVAGLRDDHQLLAGKSLRPRLEDVEVGVRTDHAHGAARELGETCLGLVALGGADLAEAGREHDRERHPLADALLDRGSASRTSTTATSTSPGTSAMLG